MDTNQTAADWPGLPFGLNGAARRMREHPLRCWALTVALVAGSLVLRAIMGMAGAAPFLPFYPAIMAATVLAGRRTGYGALVLTVLAAVEFLYGPGGSPALAHDGFAALVLHVAVSVAVVEILARLGISADRLVAHQRLLATLAEDLAEREARSAAQLSELEALYDEAPIGLGFLDRELRFVRVNTALAEMNGPTVTEHIGLKVWDIVPDLRQSAEPMLRRVLETGEILRGVELSGETPARPGERRDWIEMFYPVRDATGAIVGVGLCCSDITELARARDREALLTREVDHRAKNLLAVVQSVLHLTRSAGTVEEFKAAVAGRIQALGRVHTLLAENRWDGVALGALMHQELAPFGSAVTITGDDRSVVLEPSVTQAVSMILYELATNSAKHGALSGSGRVELGCAIEADAIALSWVEKGGPAVAPPTHAGFGTSLIERTVSRLLGGTLDYRLEPDGLVCNIRFPRGKARAGSGAAAVAAD